MRTHNMIYENKKKNRFTLDTCFLIQGYQNPKVLSSFIKKGSFGTKIFINEITLNEIERVGFDKTAIILKMIDFFGQIIIKDVTNEERIFGSKLEKTCSTLHPGDSSILTFAKRTSSILVTLDKDLARSCKFFSVDCILIRVYQKIGDYADVS